MAEQIKTTKQLTIGDFIKFTDKDKQGKFSYVGEVMSISDGWISILTFEGEMAFKICPENSLEKISTPPVGWKKYRANPEKHRLEVILEKRRVYEAEAAAIKSLRDKIKDFVLSKKERNLDKLLKIAVKEFKDADPKILKNYIQLTLLKA